MNSKVKDLWLTALRSGTYNQTKSTLANAEGHCCLGVLCDVAIKNGLDISVEVNQDGEFIYDGETNYLPESIQLWADISENPSVTRDDGNEDFLSILNDYHLNFNEIADLIEENL